MQRVKSCRLRRMFFLLKLALLTWLLFGLLTSAQAKRAYKPKDVVSVESVSPAKRNNGQRSVYKIIGLIVDFSALV